MRKHRALVITLVLAVAGLSMVALVWAQAVKRTSQADITSQKFTYDWKSSEFIFTGNCRVEIKGPDKATMTAPRVVGKITTKGQQVNKLTASGPVTFDFTTARDADGVQRRIVASCSGQAIYDGVANTVTLTGGAEAQMTALPAAEGQEPTKFSGTKLIVNFKSYTVEGEGVHFEVEIPEPSTEATPAAPAADATQ